MSNIGYIPMVAARLEALRGPDLRTVEPTPPNPRVEAVGILFDMARQIPLRTRTEAPLLDPTRFRSDNPKTPAQLISEAGMKLGAARQMAELVSEDVETATQIDRFTLRGIETGGFSIEQLADHQFTAYADLLAGKLGEKFERRNKQFQEMTTGVLVFSASNS